MLRKSKVRVVIERLCTENCDIEELDPNPGKFTDHEMSSGSGKSTTIKIHNRTPDQVILDA